MTQLTDAMQNVDSAELLRKRASRRRSVAVNAVLEVMSTQGRTIVTDNDADLMWALFSLTDKVTPGDLMAPALKAEGPTTASVAALVETLNAEPTPQ